MRYVLSRLLQAVGVLWAAYTVSFLVLYALPGDPVRIMIGTDATDVTEAQLDELRAQFGLDKPIALQYLEQLLGVLRGDLGVSIATGRPVAYVIGEAIPPTLQISAAALVLAVVFGIAIAVLAAYTRSRRLSALLLALPPLGVAVPGFWLGLMLIQWFSFQIPLFPAAGVRGAGALVLPAITLAVPTGALIAQLLSKSLFATLREPYIDTAWAKGAARPTVYLRHALRNAALPALTMTGLVMGQLLSGTVVTETVFSRPGIGRVTAAAVQQQDIPLVQGVVLFAAAVFVSANLLVDLVYPLFDPRIVLDGGSPRRRALRRLAAKPALALALAPDDAGADTLAPAGSAPTDSSFPRQAP
ncbi:ABC transporter permease [Microbacterium sp. 18062]|uniref:ABC transporter permease n=1 Tax=Microbacterium sp. 18062 TaxID=2681410 RepID=UPI0013576A41|nr:ABC transporter permease [Microbacterium sp. 18062]